MVSTPVAETGERRPGLPGRLSVRSQMALLFALMAVLRGAVYATVLPPWQSNDEHGHYEYAWLISQYGPAVGPESISLEFQRRVLASMYRFEYWRFARQPMPDVLPNGFTDPSDTWLRQSRPQVGDERPLYYLLVGALLRLVGDRDLLLGMYIGRAVSVILFAAAVGMAAVASYDLFPESRFLRVVPPAFVLFLPVLGQMAASVNSDAIGVLTCTVFFVRLIPVFRGGASVWRIAVAGAALVLALVSKKAAVFLLPTAALAVPLYWWTRRRRFARAVWLSVSVCVVVLVGAGLGLRLVPSGNAAGWVQASMAAEPTRTEEYAVDGRAAFRVGAGAGSRVSQTLVPEIAREQAGQPVVLTGWFRSVDGDSKGMVAIVDNDGQSGVELNAAEEWKKLTVTHTVTANARWMSVRFVGEGQRGPLLFDGLTLANVQGVNLLRNSSAERKESLLLKIVRIAARQFGVPGSASLAEFLLSAPSWDTEALRVYRGAVIAAFRSFWGLFGSVTLGLPTSWYRATAVVSLLALVGNIVSAISGRRTRWRAGYMGVLVVGSLVLILQTVVPMVGMRGTTWLPQGRYLFPGVFALAVLLARGWWSLLPSKWDRWATVVASGVVATFDVLCLGLVIIPYYRGV